jgi:hypothetical protein
MCLASAELLSALASLVAKRRRRSKPAIQKGPAKLLLDLTEPDPINAMLNSLACESDENN